MIDSLLWPVSDTAGSRYRGQVVSYGSIHDHTQAMGDGWLIDSTQGIYLLRATWKSLGIFKNSIY